MSRARRHTDTPGHPRSNTGARRGVLHRHAVNEWTVRDFYPIDYIPRGVRLTAYSGGAADLPANVLQDFLDAVAAGDAVVPISRVYQLEEIRQAHAEMEAGSATGKIVVLTPHAGTQSTHL